jgi:hypothetical protein
MPWQDTISTERVGWRQRAANLDGVFAFAVDYQVCLAGWVGWSNPPHAAAVPAMWPGRCGRRLPGLRARQGYSIAGLIRSAYGRLRER